jgi:hypothetical protein
MLNDLLAALASAEAHLKAAEETLDPLALSATTEFRDTLRSPDLVVSWRS